MFCQSVISFMSPVVGGFYKLCLRMGPLCLLMQSLCLLTGNCIPTNGAIMIVNALVIFLVNIPFDDSFQLKLCVVNIAR